MNCYQQSQANTSRTKNIGCGRPFSTGSGNESLLELMSQWVNGRRAGFHKFLDGYRSAKFLDTLDAASHGEWPPNSEKAGKRHDHQRRISGEAIKQWADSLGKAQARIQAFHGCSFEKLFDFLDVQARAISGIGPLMVYDTALRIGANIGCLPKDFVYLHAHARIPSLRSDVYRIKKSELPREFKVLGTWEAYEIEDFLCVYQEQILRLTSRSPKNVR